MLSRTELAGAYCRLCCCQQPLVFSRPAAPPPAPAPPQVVVNGKQALNFASLNFLGIAGLEDVSCREGFGRRARLRVNPLLGGHAGRRPGSSSSHGVLAWPAMGCAHKQLGLCAEHRGCRPGTWPCVCRLCCRSGSHAGKPSTSTAWGPAGRAASTALLMCTCSWRWARSPRPLCMLRCFGAAL